MGFLDFLRRKPVAKAAAPAPALQAPPPATKQPAVATSRPSDGQQVSSTASLVEPNVATWPVAKERVPAVEVAPAKEVPTRTEIPHTQSRPQARTESASAPAEQSFALWVDPKVEPPTGEWERRLNTYARKCARQLIEAGVPLFQTIPCDGDGHYCDAFWLIACDVEWGEKSMMINPRLWGTGGESYEKLDIRGWFYGRALLLTKSGVLCTAFLQAALIKKGGGVSDRALSATFTEIERPIDKFRTWDWGWSNRGRWRRDPGRDLSLHGVKITAHGECFEWWHDPKTSPDDGRGTSAALSAFVKSNGRVRWPRGFLQI